MSSQLGDPAEDPAYPPLFKTQIRDRPHPLIKIYRSHHKYHLNIINIIKMFMRMLCKFFNYSLPRMWLFLNLEISSIASNMYDIKEMITIHLTLLSLGTPVSM